MADEGNTVSCEILFNKFAVKAAQRRALVQSWMADAKESPSRHRSQTKKQDEEEAETFGLDSGSELLGLGANVQLLSQSERARVAPDSRLEDASTAFLRKELLGKQKNNQTAHSARPAISMLGLEPGFTPNRSKSAFVDGAEGNGQKLSSTASRLSASTEYIDDEDEVGRSGVGRKVERNTYTKGRKEKQTNGKERAKQEAENSQQGTAMDVDSGEDDDGGGKGERLNGSNLVPTIRSTSNGAKRKPASYLDELLSQKSEKKKKKRRG